MVIDPLSLQKSKIMGLLVFILLMSGVVGVEIFLLEALPRYFYYLRGQLFMLLESEKMMRIHEVGHYLAYLKECSHYNERKYRKMLTKIICLAQGKNGGVMKDKSKSWSPKKKTTLAAGVAAELAVKNKKMTLWKYYLHRYVLGAGSDMNKLQYVFGLKRRDIIELVNKLISEYTEEDIVFIKNTEASLAQKELKRYKGFSVKAHCLENSELFSIGYAYRTQRISETLVATSCQNSVDVENSSE